MSLSDDMTLGFIVGRAENIINTIRFARFHFFTYSVNRVICNRRLDVFWMGFRDLPRVKAPGGFRELPRVKAPGGFRNLPRVKAPGGFRDLPRVKAPGGFRDSPRVKAPAQDFVICLE